MHPMPPSPPVLTENFSMRTPGALPGWRRLALALLIPATLLLSACSNINLAYTHAETLIRLWADQYADFTREQDQLVKPRLRDLLAWHRGAQLPEYVRIIERVDARLDPARGKQPVTAAEVMAFEDEFRFTFTALAERSLPDLAELTLTLTPAQIERIDRKMGESIEKYASFEFRVGAHQ